MVASRPSVVGWFPGAIAWSSMGARPRVAMVIGRAGVVGIAVDKGIGAKGLDTVLIAPTILAGGIKIANPETGSLGRDGDRQTGNPQIGRAHV